MNTIKIASRLPVARNDTQSEQVSNDEQNKLNWHDSSSVQHLLDVISSIIAEEYIVIAKENPEVFSKIASGASRPRNDTPAGGVRHDRLGNEVRNDTF